ncbi:MAG: Ig-like domain-containing protein [Myxococcota bacterium]
MFVWLAGCTLSPAAPSIDSVSPTWGYNGEPTEIEISGAHFFPTVIVGDVIDPEDDDGRVEGTFQAWLVGDQTYALEDVQHVSYDVVSAEVPEGVPIGVYDLRVEVPSGLVTTGVDLFTVTDTRADHLHVTVEDFAPAYTVGEEAALTVRLEDPEDQGVRQTLEVEIVAVPSDPLTKVSFEPDGLIDQETIDGGVRGWLSSTGVGQVKVTSEVVDNILFKVDAVAPTTIEGDEIPLSWAAGDVASVEVLLPSENFQAVAGEPFDVTIRFLDPFGNVLPSAGTTVNLADACTSGSVTSPTWYAFGAEVGEGDTVTIELTEACAANKILVNAVEGVGESDTFAVIPAEHVGYTVAPVYPVVTAGAELPIFVAAVDEFGNLLTDHTATLTLYDDLGGLDPWRARGEQVCSGFVAGTSFCLVRAWTAGTDVVIRAVDPAGKVGFAEPIEIVPAEASALLVVIDEPSVEAGETFPVTVHALDAYDNSVEFDPTGADPVVWSDDSGTIACVWSGSDESGQRFDCTIVGAVADANVEARVLGLVSAAAGPLVVTNAALADVEVDPQGTTFVAGSAFTVALRGFDSFGNAYLVQTDPEIDLTDNAGTLVPDTAVLGPAGTVEVSAVVYRAGTAVRLYASQGGVGLGASRPLLVSPDVLDSLQVDAPAWVSVDEPAAIGITAVDAYGNAVPTYAGSVTLSSAGGGCDTVVVTGFSDGTAHVDLDCPTPQLSDELRATDTAGYAGESDVMDIVDLACADGPTAVLELDGDDDTIRCLADGASLTVTADSSGSLAGADSIAVRHFTDVESTSVRTPSDSATFTYDTTGTRSIEVLVADARACADLAVGEAYIGSNDGEATGPIIVATSAPTVAAGGTLTVTVAARDCTEDLAAGQRILVRADLGSVGGTSTGSGLTVTLDAVGATIFTWSFVDSGYAGIATVYAGSAGGGAIGSRSVLVTGDSAHPTVLEATPTGTHLGSIESITVTFSEAMTASLFTNLYVPLTGPSGTVSATYTLSADGTTVVVTPNTPIDGSTGSYTLSLSQNLRDLAGNRLDGGWSGVWGPAVFSFGNLVDTVPDITACAASGTTFTPDGDDGAGSDADEVTVTPTAAGSPAWWWFTVYDADETRVRSHRTLGTASQVRWDGRGDDGILRDAGPYRLSISAIDGNGNVGGQCDVTVDLQQYVDP